jgi:tetratricopeptide (TPR) repeat protein
MADTDHALALAEKYVTERPTSVPRLLVLGDLQLSAQHNDAALATYRKAWAKEKSGQTLERTYVALTRTDKNDEGLKLLQDWSAQNPGDDTVRFMIASHYMTVGNYDAALNETEKMNGRLPDNPVLLNNLAWLYGMKKDPKAITIAEKAYRLAPQSPDVMDTLGWLQVNQGDQNRGIALLGKAFEAAPKRPEIAYHYAAALQRKGDTGRAKDVLGPALEVKATFTDRPKAEALYKELGG